MRNSLFISAKGITFALLLLVPFGAAQAVLYTFSQAPGPDGMGCLPIVICDWGTLQPIPNPGGDIWIDFESAPGLDDMAHFEFFPGDAVFVSAVFFGNYTFLSPPLNPLEIFLTEMNGLTIPHNMYELEVLSANTPSDTATFLDFEVLFNEHVFVHDLHFDCPFDPMDPPVDSVITLVCKGYSLSG